MNRRDAIQTVSATAALSMLGPLATFASTEKVKDPVKFIFCLNTSTISGQKLGIEKYIDITARAGYDAIELWIPDIKIYQENGGTLGALKKKLNDSKLPVVNAIGFAPWMKDNETIKTGFIQMKEEMEIMAALGCPRIAASSAGIAQNEKPDLFQIGESYSRLIELGKQTGVMPQLEFWGASSFFHLGQALMAAAVANHQEAKILADVYHLFRGNSGFEGLKMMDGRLIDIFHMNDFTNQIPREKQDDKDRVYPGDGVAPMKQILTDLKKMRGSKILSLELFNREYWAQDPLLVAKTGLSKMKKLAEAV